MVPFQGLLLRQMELQPIFPEIFMADRIIEEFIQMIDGKFLQLWTSHPEA